MGSERKSIVIAGGGVIGASIAYELSKLPGLDITLIDIKKSGNATRASAGGLWAIGESVGLGCGVIFFKTLSKQRQESGDRALEIQRPHQLPTFFFDFCLQSNQLFPGLWRELMDLTGIDFKLRQTGLNFILYDQADREYAQSIYDSIPHLQDQIEWLDRNQLRRQEPFVTSSAIGALKFIKDDQVNPYLLMQALVAGAKGQGVKVIRNEVVGVKVENGRVRGVQTRDGDYPCEELINSAGAWAREIGMMVGLSIPVEPVKGQIVLTEKLPPLLRACWSTSDCYIAQKDNGEILIGSTTENAGFNTLNSFEQLKSLCAGAMRAIPALASCNIKRTWAGLRPGTPDEIPILGRAPGLAGYINACGHFRTGILTSAITARMIVDVVLDRQSLSQPDVTPFLLDRFEKISKSP